MTQLDRFRIVTRRPGVAAGLFALVMVGMLAGGCSVQWRNAEPLRTLQADDRAASPYLGWRVYQTRCAVCHGPEATGTSRGPDLLPRVALMSERRFTSIILGRYDLEGPISPGRASRAVSDQVVDEVLQRRAGLLRMPVWDGEPAVVAQVQDLYVYLMARTQGDIDAGRPEGSNGKSPPMT